MPRNYGRPFLAVCYFIFLNQSDEKRALLIYAHAPWGERKRKCSQSKASVATELARNYSTSIIVPSVSFVIYVTVKLWWSHRVRTYRTTLGMLFPNILGKNNKKKKCQYHICYSLCRIRALFQNQSRIKGIRFK